MHFSADRSKRPHNRLHRRSNHFVHRTDKRHCQTAETLRRHAPGSVKVHLKHLYGRLTLKDIKEACDALDGVYSVHAQKICFITPEWGLMSEKKTLLYLTVLDLFFFLLSNPISSMGLVLNYLEDHPSFQ